MTSIHYYPCDRYTDHVYINGVCFMCGKRDYETIDMKNYDTIVNEFKEMIMPTVPPSAETRRDWEVVQENVGQDKTERLRIISGWLYRTTVAGVGVALVYVPPVFGE